jgi:hypothetical protein
MALAVHQADPNQPAQPKARRKRSPSVPQPVFFVIQMTDEQGQPVAFDKKRIKLVTVERDPNIVMELMDNATHQHAFYLRGVVPVKRVGQPRATPTQTA